MARRQSWRSLSLRGLRKRKRRETALLIWRGTALKETKTRVRRDRMSLFDLTFTCCLLSFTFTDHSQWRIHYFFSPFLSSTPGLTEIKEAIFIVGDGETKPASPSSSPTAHCPPPSLESQPSSANQVVDNAQLSNSQSVKASSTSGEGRSCSTYLCVSVPTGQNGNIIFF